MAKAKGTGNAGQGSAVESEEDTQVPEMSYEAARAELIDVVAKLESGGVALADSMKLWERGEALAKICQTWLDGAAAKIQASAG
ncbi:MAG: exodeoxyribonuclease VII small subunit [Propionibacteriaceae bacterium]|jgi:exodeoxyribonuclease VII small subunit|nr:exodeoxyribonuclease VII small subunit [Propionibacteriaceae bacterium]